MADLSAIHGPWMGTGPEGAVVESWTEAAPDDEEWREEEEEGGDDGGGLGDVSAMVEGEGRKEEGDETLWTRAELDESLRSGRVSPRTYGRLRASLGRACEGCGRRFRNGCGLAHHRRRWPNCGDETKRELDESRWKDLSRARAPHQKRSDPSQYQIQCTKCEQRFRIQFDLMNHLAKKVCEERALRRIHCDGCAALVKNKTGLVSHWRESPGCRPRSTKVKVEVEPRCEKCARLFVSPASLRLHQASQRNCADLRCRDCGRRFWKNPALLMEHRRWRICQILKMVCPVCEREMISEPAFLAHVRRAQEGLACKKFLTEDVPKHTSTCPACQKTFGRRICMLRHLREPHGCGDQVCDSCGHVEKAMNSLRRHIGECQGFDRWYTNGPPKRPLDESMVACEKCGKRVKACSLAGHQRIGCDLRQCPRCGKTFVSGGYVRAHIRDGQCHVLGDEITLDDTDAGLHAPSTPFLPPHPLTLRALPLAKAQPRLPKTEFKAPTQPKAELPQPKDEFKAPLQAKIELYPPPKVVELKAPWHAGTEPEVPEQAELPQAPMEQDSLAQPQQTDPAPEVTQEIQAPAAKPPTKLLMARPDSPSRYSDAADGSEDGSDADEGSGDEDASGEEADQGSEAGDVSVGSDAGEDASKAGAQLRSEAPPVEEDGSDAVEGSGAEDGSEKDSDAEEDPDKPSLQDAEDQLDKASPTASRSASPSPSVAASERPSPSASPAPSDGGAEQSASASPENDAEEEPVEVSEAQGDADDASDDEQGSDVDENVSPPPSPAPSGGAKTTSAFASPEKDEVKLGDKKEKVDDYEEEEQVASHALRTETPTDLGQDSRQTTPVREISLMVLDQVTRTKSPVREQSPQHHENEATTAGQSQDDTDQMPSASAASGASSRASTPEKEAPDDDSRSSGKGVTEDVSESPAKDTAEDVSEQPANDDEGSDSDSDDDDASASSASNKEDGNVDESGDEGGEDEGGDPAEAAGQESEMELEVSFEEEIAIPSQDVPSEPLLLPPQEEHETLEQAASTSDPAAPTPEADGQVSPSEDPAEAEDEEPMETGEAEEATPVEADASAEAASPEPEEAAEVSPSKGPESSLAAEASEEAVEAVSGAAETAAALDLGRAPEGAEGPSGGGASSGDAVVGAAAGEEEELLCYLCEAPLPTEEALDRHQELCDGF